MPTDVVPMSLRPWWACVALSAVLGAVAAPAPVRAQESAPPKDAAVDEGGPLAGFQKLRRDKPPEAITRDTHYWTGNEDNLQLFYPHVKDLGGVYVGAGTDQNYLMAGWAKTEVLVLMDFDQSIVDVHGVYRAIFKAAETPEAFMELWGAKKRKAVRKLVKEEFKAEKRKKWAALKAHGTARWSIYRRLVRIRDQFKDTDIPTFLTDAAQYNHVRQLYLDDKVFRVRGDLTAKRALRSIGAAATAAKLPVRVLYLSNAEQYFKYKRDFRKNIKALPLDDKSMIVRTSGWRRFISVKGKDYYHYNVQSGPSMLAFVNDRKVRDVASVLKIAPPGEIRGFTVVTETDFAAASAAAKERKKAARAAKRKAKKKKKKATTSSRKRRGRKAKPAAEKEKAAPTSPEADAATQKAPEATAEKEPAQ